MFFKVKPLVINNYELGGGIKERWGGLKLQSSVLCFCDSSALTPSGSSPPLSFYGSE